MNQLRRKSCHVATEYVVDITTVALDIKRLVPINFVTTLQRKETIFVDRMPGEAPCEMAAVTASDDHSLFIEILP